MNAITNTEQTAVTAAFKVDVSQGRLDGRVSSQWYSRPDDQKFLNLTDLGDFVRARSELATQRIVDVNEIEVIANDSDTLTIKHRDLTPELNPTHWSFGQVSSLAGAPASYLRKLPAQLAGINLQYGLRNLRSENVKLYHTDSQILAATGAEYGRVMDLELVEAVKRIAGNGTGDTNWKVPGAIDWSNGTYNPFVDITTDTTTLYASDRDVFMFLVDDTRPIEIGKLPDGSPDLVFRGFYTWNSEVGSKTLGISTFLLRGVCQNRNLWGVQDKNSMTIRHSKNAPNRFAQEVGPALVEYSRASDRGVISGIIAAKQAVVARSDDDRLEFLGKRGFTKGQAQKVVDAVLREEGHPPTSVWDFVNGITAVARNIGHTDDRVDMEKRAGQLLSKAAEKATDAVLI